MLGTECHDAASYRECIEWRATALTHWQRYAGADDVLRADFSLLQRPLVSFYGETAVLLQ